jgi:hypothetical protein
MGRKRTQTNNLNLYALALSAYAADGSIAITAHAVVAVDNNDALKHGKLLATLQWPVADGWTRHAVTIERFSDQAVKLAYQNIKS